MTWELLEVAEEAALAGAERLQRRFRSGTLEVDAKGRHDFVTDADRSSEKAILDVLRRRCPDHAVLSEEAGELGGAGDHEWIVDPLDGTTNFLQGLDVYGVSVACRRAGRTEVGVIVEPEAGHVFRAVRGQGATWNGAEMRVRPHPGLEGAFLATGYPFRAKGAIDLYLEVFRDVFLACRAIRRCGAAVLDLAYTAAGIYDGFFEFRLSAWDLAAGALLVEEAGGRATDLDGGDRYLESGNLVAGAPGVHAELLARVNGLVDEAGMDRHVPRFGLADAVETPS